MGDGAFGSPTTSLFCIDAFLAFRALVGGVIYPLLSVNAIVSLPVDMVVAPDELLLPRLTDTEEEVEASEMEYEPDLVEETEVSLELTEEETSEVGAVDVPCDGLAIRKREGEGAMLSISSSLRVPDVDAIGLLARVKASISSEG